MPVLWYTMSLKEVRIMKNYVKPEIEVLSFQAESVMLNLGLTTSNVEGGFTERN